MLLSRRSRKARRGREEHECRKISPNRRGLSDPAGELRPEKRLIFTGNGGCHFPRGGHVFTRRLDSAGPEHVWLLIMENVLILLCCGSLRDVEELRSSQRRSRDPLMLHQHHLRVLRAMPHPQRYEHSPPPHAVHSSLICRCKCVS